MPLTGAAGWGGAVDSTGESCPRLTDISLACPAISLRPQLCSVAGMHFFFLVLVRSATLCLLLAPLLIKHRCNPFKLNAA